MAQTRPFRYWRISGKSVAAPLISASISCLCAADHDRPCQQQLKATPPVCFLKRTWRPGEQQLNMLGSCFATASYTASQSMDCVLLNWVNMNMEGSAVWPKLRSEPIALRLVTVGICKDEHGSDPIWKPSLLFRSERDLAQCVVTMQGRARGKRGSGRPGYLSTGGLVTVISVGSYREKGYRISANYFPRKLFFQCQLFFGGGGGVLIFESRSYTGGEVTFSMSSFPFWHKFIDPIDSKLTLLGQRTRYLKCACWAHRKAYV